uniref:UspA domain-containing protein n=1 Tax=Glycine max TaxID=3847 RepID=I1JFI6_SOYBN
MAASSSEKQVVVIGIDDSEQSTYALNWALDNFFPSPIFKLVLIHSRPTATSAVGFAGPGAAEVLPIVDSDLRKIGARVLETAKQLCINKSVILFFFLFPCLFVNLLILLLHVCFSRLTLPVNVILGKFSYA